MISRVVTLPELALIGGTRAALGAGIALLLADRLSGEQRRGAGWALLAVGAITTIPLVAQVMAGRRISEISETPRRPALERAPQPEPALGL